MSKAARSLSYFGMYMVVVAIILLTMPNVLLRLVSLPPTDEVWIRLMGMVVLILAYYYIRAARAELTDFFRWTIGTRSSAIVFLAVFVVLRFTKPIVMLFGVVDLLGAIWTALALRSPHSHSGAPRASARTEDSTRDAIA